MFGIAERRQGFVPEATSYTLSARFIDVKGIAVNLGMVAQLNRGDDFNSLRVGDALGLTAGHQALKPKEDVDNTVIEQLLEIERDILDPMLAAQSV